MKTSNNLFKSCLLAWFLLSQLILAVNVKPCSVELTVPDSIPVNLDDDNENEEWDKDDTPMLDEEGNPVGDDDLKACEVSIEADPQHSGTLTITFEEGSDKVGGVAWMDDTKQEEHPLEWDVVDGQLDESVPATFYLEGLEHSDDWDDVELKATLDVEAEGNSCTSEDVKTTTVVEVDLDVDSKNDNEFEFAGFDDEEDKIELSSMLVDGYPRPGKIIAPTSNKNTDNDDLPDYADGFSLEGVDPLSESASVSESLSFIPIRVELKEPFNPDSAVVIFELPTESKPEIGEGIVSFGEGSENDPKVLGINTGGIRLWKKSAQSRSSGNPVSEGDYIPGGEEIQWADIAESGSREVELYLEYVEATPFVLQGQQEITVTIIEEDVEAEDIVKVLFAPVDLDVDSDNNNTKELPDRTPTEEGFQYASDESDAPHERPGKLLYVNSGDEDYDGIPDYADGFEDKFEDKGIPMDSEEDDGSDGFAPQSSEMVPIIFDFPEIDYDDEKIIVTLEYDDSDPTDLESSEDVDGRTIYELPEDGAIRIWSKNCRPEEDGLRSILPVLDGGHFIKADTDMKMSELRPLLESAEAGGYVLYVESVKKSSKIADQSLTVKVKLDSSIIFEEKISFTSVEMNLVTISESGNTSKSSGYGLSHSSPVITITEQKVSEPYFNVEYDQWEVDIFVSGTIESDFLDTVPEEQGGVIDKVYVHLNGSNDPMEGGVIDVEVVKDFDSSSLTKPFPYSGTFSKVIESAVVPDGDNILSVRTRDKVFQVDGVVASTVRTVFPKNPPPVDDGGGDDGGGSGGGSGGGDDDSSGNYTQTRTTTHTIEFLDDPNDDVINNIRYSAVVDGIFAQQAEYEELGADVQTFVNSNELPYFVDIPSDLAFSESSKDAIHARFLDNGGDLISDVYLYETGVNNKIFVATFVEYFSTSGGSSEPDEPVVITDPVIFYETDGGEFHPHAFEMEGPTELIEKFEVLKFTDPTVYELNGASASSEFEAKIKEADDKRFLANVIAEEAIGIVSFRENLEGDQFESVSDKLYQSISQLQTGSLYPNDIGEFTKGFGMGIVKGGVDMVGGLGNAVKLGCKAVYEGGKTIVRAQVFQLKCAWKLVTGQKLDQEIRQMHDASDALTKKLDYFESIKDEGPEAISAILEGKFERLDNLSGAMRDMIMIGAEIFGGLVDSITSTDDYEKGIFWGRATFEIGSSFFPLSKVGAVSKLAVMNKLKNSSKFFQQGVGLAAISKAEKLRSRLPTTKMCFVAGTLISTSYGMEPIENVKKGDLVWSRSDSSPGIVELKPVIGVFVTHPKSLVEVTIDSDGDGHADDTIEGTPEHPFWVEELQQFVPMSKLSVGDSLYTIDSKDSLVCSVNLREAPLGSSFITYNFEVKDFHTYFVSDSQIWVHNSGLPCEKAKSIFRRFRSRENESIWNPFNNTITVLKGVKRPEILNQKVFNEARKLHFEEGITEPGPWLNLHEAAQTFSIAPSSANLARNLERALGYKKIPYSEAHHIIPLKESGAAELRLIMKNFKIHLDDPSNGTFMVSTRTRNQVKDPDWLDGLGPKHQNHRIDSGYLEKLNEDLARFSDIVNPTAAQKIELKNELQRIASKLVNDDYPWP